MTRSTSKRIIFVLTILSAQNGHQLQSQTEAFSFSHQRKQRLQPQHSSLSRESLLLPTIYRNRIYHPNRCHQSSRLNLLFRDSFYRDDDDDIDENEVCDPPSGTIEDARHLFEEIMSIPQEKTRHQQPLSQQHQTVPPPRTVAYLTHQITNANILKTHPPPPPLTTILRERRINELEILTSLSSSDQAITDLWSLWFSERGTEAATLLLRAEELSSRAVGASGNGGSSTSSGGSGAAGSGEEDAQEAESLLWDLIEEHGVHWVEPVNRLATLMYMRGRLEESKALCEVVLSVKPWHIGALSGIVMVCISMNDVGCAREWAEKRFPPMLLDGGANDSSGDVICSRRRAWVTRACRDAKHQLDFAEKEGRTAGDIGKREAEFRYIRTRLQKMDEVNANCNTQLTGGEDSDIWQ